NVAANQLIASSSGRGRPEGGIMPVRSFRMIFSTCARFAAGLARSTDVNENPPDFVRSLWQPVQYRLTRACWLSIGIVAENVLAAVCCDARATAPDMVEAASAAAIKTPNTAFFIGLT